MKVLNLESAPRSNYNHKERISIAIPDRFKMNHRTLDILRGVIVDLASPY